MLYKSHIDELQELLLDYATRYGLTERARRYFIENAPTKSAERMFKAPNSHASASVQSKNKALSKTE